MASLVCQVWRQQALHEALVTSDLLVTQGVLLTRESDTYLHALWACMGGRVRNARPPFPSGTWRRTHPEGSALDLRNPLDRRPTFVVGITCT